MTLICVAANKGGSGKTTTATTLASALANLYDTLLLDFDSQGHCGLAYGLQPVSGPYLWLGGEGHPLSKLVQEGRPDRLKVLVGDSRTRMVERTLTERGDLALEVIEGLRALGGRRESFVVIDTKASGILQEVALTACDQVVIPFHLEQFDLDGAHTTLALVERINPAAEITLLPVAMDIRLREHRENLEQLMVAMAGAYGLIDRRVAVRQRVAVSRAQSEGQTIWEYRADELLEVRAAYTLLLGRVLELAQVGVDYAEV